MLAYHKVSPVTHTCIGIAAFVLFASLLSDLSFCASFLDDGQEEFIILAILLPVLFFHAYRQKDKSEQKNGKKCMDFADSPQIEKPKQGVKASNTKLDQQSSRDGNGTLSEKLEGCAKTGDVIGAEALISKALESGMEVKGLSLCFGQLLQACAHAKDAKSANESFKRMKTAGVKANVVHYGTLISAHAQTGDIAGAEMCLQDCIASGVEPNTVCYNTVLYACSRAGNMAKMKEWLENMEEARIAKDHITFSTAVHGAIRAQDAACLETWMRQMSSAGFVLLPRSYEDGLAMCSQGSFSHIAEALFQDALRNSVPLTSKMVHHIARARLFSGNSASCMEVLENARKDGLDLLPASFVTAAEASNKFGDTLASTAWLSQAEKKLAHSTDNFALIASTALCAGKLDSAASWMQKLEECGTADQVTTGYLTMLKCCARLNDDASACSFADRALKNGVSLTGEGYSAAIKACCRASNLQAAESWLNKMIQAGPMEDPAPFCCIIGLCARLENVSRGEFWLNRMSSTGHQSDTCLKAFLDTCERSQSKDAKVSASRVITKVDVNRIHFSSGENSLFLLKSLIRFGHIKKGESLLLACVSKLGKNVAAQGHQAIINAYAQEGNFRVAEAWLTRMTDAGLPADVIAYSTIIHACAKAGDPLRAEGVLVRMQCAQVEPNTICFNEVINAFAEAGDLEKAEQYFEAIKQRNLTPSTSTYNSILKACAKSGDVIKAEAWYHKMTESGLQGVELDATTFGTLMNASKDTDPMKTEQWLQAARSHGVKLNVVHFSTAIHAHAKVGAFEKAEALLEQALADGIEVNTMCYNNVISACAEASLPDRAEGWLLKMRQSGVNPNSFTCYTVVNAWLKVKDFARVKRAIDTMEKDGLQPREEVFTAFAKAAVRSGTRADFEDCIMMASQRGCQDNEFFLHAHVSALVNFRASPHEVETVVRAASKRGVKPNQYIRNVLNRALPYSRTEALIEECGGISEVAARRKPVQHNRNRV